MKEREYIKDLYFILKKSEFESKIYYNKNLFPEYIFFIVLLTLISTIITGLISFEGLQIYKEDIFSRTLFMISTFFIFGGIFYIIINKFRNDIFVKAQNNLKKIQNIENQYLKIDKKINLKILNDFIFELKYDNIFKLVEGKNFSLMSKKEFEKALKIYAEKQIGIKEANIKAEKAKIKNLLKED